MSTNATLPLFRWRDAFCSKDGPPAITRLVLWTLSKHMDMYGADCFPSQETVAKESRLSLKAVKIHLRRAERDGWIERSPRRPRGKAKASFRYGTDYLPRFPLPAQIGEPDTPNVQDGIGVIHASIGVRDTALGNDVPTISSKNSSMYLDACKKELYPAVFPTAKLNGRRPAFAGYC